MNASKRFLSGGFFLCCLSVIVAAALITAAVWIGCGSGTKWGVSVGTMDDDSGSSSDTGTDDYNSTNCSATVNQIYNICLFVLQLNGTWINDSATAESMCEADNPTAAGWACRFNCVDFYADSCYDLQSCLSLCN